MPYLYVYEELKQYETYFRNNCADYPGETWGHVLILGSKLPIVAFTVSVVLAIKDPTRPHRALGYGFLLLGLFTAVAAALNTDTPSDDPKCANRVVGRPADGAAIMWFIVGWWLNFEIMKPFSSFFRGVLLVLCAAWHSYANVRLGLHSNNEVIIGSVIGLAVGFVAHVTFFMSRILQRIIDCCYDPTKVPPE